MIWLIKQLNKWATSLVYMRSSMLKSELWMLLLHNDVMNNVKYLWNDNDSIKLAIITEDDLSYKQIIKIRDLISKFNDEHYDGVCIYPEFWTEERYKEVYGED